MPVEEFDKYGIPIKKSTSKVDKYGIPIKKKDQSKQDFTTPTEPLSKSGEEDKETRTRNFVELKQDYDEDQAQSIDIISNIFENKGIEEDYPVSEWGDEYLNKLEKNKAALEEAVKQHQRNLSPLAEEYDVSAERVAQSTFNVDKWLLNKESGKILEESSIAFKEYYLSKNPEAKKILESDSSTEEQVDEVVQDIYNQWTKQPEELAGLDIYKKEGREADLFTTDAGEFATALGSIADAFETGVDDADYSKKLTGELSFATDDEKKVILDKLYRKSLYEAKKVQDVGDDMFSAEGFSGMLGSQRDALAGSMLLAAIPIPGVNVAASMLYSGQDAARAAYGTAMSQTFNEARNEGFSVEEAFSKAKKQAVVEATGGFIEGVAGAGTSGLANRFGIAVSKKFASKPISFLVNQAAEGLSDVGLDGSVAAINQIASNLSKNLMGIDTDMFSGVPDAIIGEMLFSGVFKVPGTVKTSADLRRFVKSLPRAEQQKIFQDFVDAKKSMDSKITNDRANQYVKLQKDQAKSEKNFSLEKQIDKDPVGHLINERDRLNTLFEGMSTEKGKAQVKENIDAINTMIKNMEGYTVTDADGNTQVVSRKDLAKSIEDPKFIDAVAQGDIDVTIDNDNELSQLLFSKIDALTKTEEDAVQEQKPDEVPVQPEVEAGKEVEGEVPESRPEEPTKEVKEEVERDTEETSEVEAKKADIERRRQEFPETQSNTRTPITQKLLDYFAEVKKLPKFTEDLTKGTYVSWLQNNGKLGYKVAELLNSPKKAFDLIAKYNAELPALESTQQSKKEGKQPTKKQKVKPTTIKKQNVSDVDAIVGRAKNEEQKSALATISNVVKALTGIDKDVEVIVHEDADSYNAEVERQGGDPTDVSSGFFDNGSQIHINASEVQNTTAFHEGGHKVIASYVKRTPGAVDKFKSQLESKLPKKDVDSLNEFVSEYDSEEQSEEFVTETLARIASGDIKLDKSALDKIKDYLRGLAKSLGMDPDMIKLTGKEDVQDFARKLSEAFTEGKEISIKEVSDETFIDKSKIKAQKKPDVNKIRKLSRTGSKVGKGMSVKMVNKNKVSKEIPDLSSDYVRESNPKAYIKNANLINKFPFVQGVRSKGEITDLSSANEVYETFTDLVSDNLVYLTESFNKELRDISTLWYDGANIMANDMASKYGVKPEQSAAIIAALSPQKDWYQNVNLAERVMLSFKENPILTKEMVDFQSEINNRGGKNKTGESLKKHNERSNIIINNLSNYIDKSLSEVPNDVKPYIVRLNDEVNNSKDYNVLSPDGKNLGVAKKANGENRKVAWGSYGEIGKAVSIYLDGSQDNISNSLGEMHKIRNFYNNIIDPMSKDGDVTMDTHAIAAALISPLSGNSDYVSQNFGGKAGVASSKADGFKGIYYAYSDAYAKAAERLGLLPRQVQSITWEAVRGLFSPKYKSNKDNVSYVESVWNDFKNKKINIDEARQKIIEHADGISDPSWGFVFSKPKKGIKKESEQRGISGVLGDDPGAEVERRAKDAGRGNVLSNKDLDNAGIKEGMTVRPVEKKGKFQKKAPNGKPSNLNEEQYEAVRTPEFKNWFGDWENDPKNASKVVDENGEPLVVYHGSPTVDIEEFDRSSSEREQAGINEMGTYFATNKNLSNIYSKAPLTEEAKLNRGVKIKALEEKQNKVRNNRDFDALTEEIDALKKGERVYPVFLNIRDMHTFDGNAEVNIEAWNNLELNLGYKWAKGRAAMEALAGKNRMVKNMKVDGIKAENIIDMSIGALYSPEVYKKTKEYKEARDKYLGDVYLLFDDQPENIKLADGTNRTFDPKSPNIKLQKKGEPKPDPKKDRVDDVIKGIIDKVRARVSAKADPKKVKERQLNDALNYLQRSKWYEDATDTQREAAVISLKKSLGEKIRRKTKWTEAIAETAMRTAKGEMKLVDTWKEQLKNLKMEERASKKGEAVGKKQEKARVREFRDIFRAWVEENSEVIRSTDAALSGEILKRVSGLTEKNIDATIEKITKAIERAERKRAEKIAKSVQSKINRASKKAPLNVKNLGKSILMIKPRYLNDPTELTVLANEYLRAVRGGGAVDNIVSEVKRLSDQAESNYQTWLDERLKKDYEVSDFKDVMTFSEFKEMMTEALVLDDSDSKLQVAGKAKSKTRQKLERVIKWRLVEIRQKLIDESKTLSSKQKDTLEAILKINDEIDIDNFTTAELKDLNNVISEIFTFDSYRSSGTIEQTIIGKIRAKEIKNSNTGIVFSKFIDEKLIGGHMAKLVSFGNFFKSIAGSKGGLRLKNMIMGPLNRANNVVLKKSDTFNSKFDKIARNIKGKDRAMTKIGMVSYIVQNESGLVGDDLKNDFEAKKLLMSLEIKKINEISKDKTLSSSQRNNYKKKAELQQEIYDKHIKQAKSKDDVFGSLTGDEKNLYDFVLGSFAEIKDDLKDSHERFDGSEFIEIDNYIPTVQVKVDNLNDKDLAISSKTHGIRNIDEKQSGTTIKRVKIQTKNADGTVKKDATTEDIRTVQIYDMNLLAKQKFKEAAYDIGTLKERRVLNSLLNSREMKEMFGKTLHPILVRKIGSKIDMQKGSFQDGLNEASKFARAYFNAMRYYRTLKLKTVDQWLKQPGSIIAHSVGQIGGRATLAASRQIFNIYTSKESMDAFNKLISQSEIANRVSEGEYLYKDQKSLIEVAMRKGKLDQATLGKIYLEAFDGALQNGDLFATRLSWLAAYMKEAKKNGTIKSYSDFDIIDAAENIDLDALAKADDTSQQINNVSDYSDAPEMFTRGENHLTRELLYNFRSFSVNMWINNAIALRDLVNSKGIEVDKAKSARLMAGSMMAVVTFQAMKQMVVNPLWDEILSILGIEDDDDEKEISEKVYTLIYNSIADYLVGGAPGGEFTEGALKRSVNFISKLFDPEVASGEKHPPFYVKEQFIPGTFGMPLEPVEGLYELAKDYAEDKELKDYNAYKGLGLASGILGEGTLDRLFSKASSKEKKLSSREKKRPRVKRMKVRKVSKEREMLLTQIKKLIE